MNNSENIDLRNLEVLKRNISKKIEKYEGLVTYYNAIMKKEPADSKEYRGSEVLKMESNAVLYELRELKSLIAE